MADQIDPLHEICASGSRMTDVSPNASFAIHRVRLQDQLNRFSEIGSGFLKRMALRIRTRQFFDGSDISFGNLLENPRLVALSS